MVQGYKEIVNAWPLFSSVLSAPQTDEELDKLIEFADYLIDRTGGYEEHPLNGLLELVGTLIDRYEDEHIPEPEGAPIGCLKYLMEEHGLRQKDLSELGCPGVISEILSGKREFNKRHIKAFSERFGCNPAIFI